MSSNASRQIVAPLQAASRRHWLWTQTFLEFPRAIAEIWLCFEKTKYEPCRGKNTSFIAENLVTKSCPTLGTLAFVHEEE
jgi:hypothetical protein